MLRPSAVRLAYIRDFTGATGRIYKFEKLLQERRYLGRVWSASCANNLYVLKDIPESYHAAFNEDLRRRLVSPKNVRLPCDEIPGQRILVYDYFKNDYLRFRRKNLFPNSHQFILRETLRGIAELHSLDIAHLDIKPDNVMIQDNEHQVEEVRVSDIENAVYIPPGRNIKGFQAGNEYWRSPEALMKGMLNKPSDIFSFGLVCIYAVLGKIILADDEDLKKLRAEDAYPNVVRLQRMVSNFGDQEGFEGLTRHISDSSLDVDVLRILWEGRVEGVGEHEFQYRNFTEWPDTTDDVFKDLIMRLNNLDPKKRLTAEEALQHPWFEDCD